MSATSKRQRENLPSKLVMLPLNSDIQNFLMPIALLPRLAQSLDLVILQSSPHRRLELLPANLLQGLALPGRLEPRLETGLHSDPDGCLEGHGGRVAADINRRSARYSLLSGSVFLHTEKRLLIPAACLEGEYPGNIQRGNSDEGFEVGDS